MTRPALNLQTISMSHNGVLLSGVCLFLLTHATLAQRPSTRLPRDETKNGASTLRAFKPIVSGTRNSVVSFLVDGKEAALGTIIDTNGVAVTKASEVSAGELTCKLSDGREVEATLLAVDDENDVGLVKVEASGLKPITWASQSVTVGEWAVTPGIGETPEAVGIISVPPRKIYPKRALIGVVLDRNGDTATIAQITPGMGAEKAGLKPGDTILSVNDSRVATADELMRTVRNFREGQTVKLRARRGEEEIQASIELMTQKLEGRWRGLARRQERMNRLGGELSRRAEGFRTAIQHDTVLQPWQCGGPVLNLEGRAIGLNIARAGRVASYALPAALIQELINELESRKEIPVRLE